MDIVSRFVEVQLPTPENFLKVKETLTRMGLASNAKRTLWQSCHILHKRQHYYIVHFKELLELDGLEVDFTDEDRRRRNTIISLLGDWKLVTIVRPEIVADRLPVSRLKIIPFREKGEWTLVPKYMIGKKSA